jgi:hypothetical protein
MAKMLLQLVFVDFSLESDIRPDLSIENMIFMNSVFVGARM